MSDTAAAAATKPITEDKSFHDVLRALVGKIVTTVNPESYEHAPVGFQIRSGFYRAKVVGVGRDYLILMTEFPTNPRDKETGEPVKQFIPLGNIKRISVMKGEVLLHL